MLAVAMLVQMATMPGQTFGISAFNPHLLRTFSLSQSELSGAYMFGTFLASIPMIYVGSLMDRHGPRKTLAGVASLFGLACIGMSQTQGLFSVFLGFLFLRMLGQGAMAFLTANTVAMWFNRHLGIASGIMSLGEAISIGVFPAMNLLLIQAMGWRTAYATLGIGVWVVVLPLLVLAFRNRPEDVGQVVDGSPPRRGATKSRPGRDHSFGEALRTRPYWIMAVASALASMTITGIHFHAVQILVEQGMRDTDAGAMFAMYAVAITVSMLIAGLLANRVPLNLLLSISMAGLSGGIALLTQVVDTSTSNLFAAVAGGAQGCFSVVSATIWVRYYGRRHLGKIRGGLTTVGVASSSAGPFVMGAAYDLFGGYHEVLWVFVAITAPMVAVSLGATRPARIQSEKRHSPNRKRT